MTIKQCYQAMGADFEEISQRIPSEAMIRKFAVKFPEDKSFAELTKALEQGNVETAFRAAHTIKGLCLTLGFSHLTAPASGLTGGGKQAVAAVHRGEDLLCMNIQKQKAGVDTLFCKRKQEGMAVWNDRRS